MPAVRTGGRVRRMDIEVRVVDVDVRREQLDGERQQRRPIDDGGQIGVLRQA
jgi:hypothetical protein